MSESFNNIGTDKEADTDKLNKIILIISLISAVFVSLITLVMGKPVLTKSFLLGMIGSLFYLRMQVMFVKNFSKRDLLSIMISILSGGRILIILGVLVVAFRRVDLFNLYAVIAGLVSVHLISISVFTYNILLNFKNDKKKLIAN